MGRKQGKNSPILGNKGIKINRNLIDKFIKQNYILKKAVNIKYKK
jgi:hypothetical protein